MIQFQNVTKAFRSAGGRHASPTDVIAVDDLSLTIDSGERHCLLGTSGCGKTTTLRLTNRLEDATRGQVHVGGRDVQDTEPTTLRRGIGYVVQRGGLFPHLTAMQNVTLPCTLSGWDVARANARGDDLLELVGLDPNAHGPRHPADLSGGQRQRIGIARALALDPEYLLLDEPFGALDPITRRTLQDELLRLLARRSATMLLVTHDLDEAFRLADRITVMRGGKIEQTGTPREIRTTPATPFVEEFVQAFERTDVDAL